MAIKFFETHLIPSNNTVSHPAECSYMFSLASRTKSFLLAALSFLKHILCHFLS